MESFTNRGGGLVRQAGLELSMDDNMAAINIRDADSKGEWRTLLIEGGGLVRHAGLELSMDDNMAAINIRDTDIKGEEGLY